MENMTTVKQVIDGYDTYESVFVNIFGENTTTIEKSGVVDIGECVKTFLGDKLYTSDTIVSETLQEEYSQLYRIFKFTMDDTVGVITLKFRK